MIRRKGLVYMAALLGIAIGTGNPSKAGAVSPLVLTATWYGPGFQGQPMANTHLFNEHDPTIAASLEFPLGTKLTLVNIENGDSAVVVVDDRGPFGRGRQLDLSEAGAVRLGYLHEGIAKLLVVTVVPPYK